MQSNAFGMLQNEGDPKTTWTREGTCIDLIAPQTRVAIGMLPQLCCVQSVQPAHWVPDSHALCCSTCGGTFGLLLRRHHCRCCGGVFCDSCSTGRAPLSGWGLEQPVRVCDECHALELRQLPLLLAGDIWSKPGDWTGRRNRRYLRLSADQSCLVWSPWRDDEGADETVERSVPISQLTCVSTAKGPGALVLHLDDGERLTFEASPGTVTLWAAALARLIATVMQRHSYERLYGGAATAPLSPRTVAVSSPRVRERLLNRQEALTDEQQYYLLRRSANGGTAQMPRDGDSHARSRDRRANGDVRASGRPTNPLDPLNGDLSGWLPAREKPGAGHLSNGASATGQAEVTEWQTETRARAQSVQELMRAKYGSVLCARPRDVSLKPVLHKLSQ